MTIPIFVYFRPAKFYPPENTTLSNRIPKAPILIKFLQKMISLILQLYRRYLRLTVIVKKRKRSFISIGELKRSYCLRLGAGGIQFE